MARYLNKKTGDLVDAWMHSAAEDFVQVAFPVWLFRTWEAGVAFENTDGDWLNTKTGTVPLPDGHFIVRDKAGDLKVVEPAAFYDEFMFEQD